MIKNVSVSAKNLPHASKTAPCPICQKLDWCYKLNDSLWVCKRSDFAPDGWRRTSKKDREGHSFFAIESDNSDWESRKAEREAKKSEREENKRLACLVSFETVLTAAERDPLIRSLSKKLGLTRAHRQLLLDRGFTEAQIDDGLFFSIEKWQKISNDYPLNLPGVSISKFGDRQLNGKGIAIVTKDVDGLATGWQILAVPRIEGFGKYTWAKGAESSHLPIGEGELPIQVVGTPGKKKVGYVAEGTLKSKLAALKHDEYFIGASSGNFSSSPVQVTAALEDIKTVVITIDSGEVTNPARMSHWQRQHEFFGSLGVKVKFLWWGQFKKSDNDVDEIATKKFKNARLIDLDRFLRLPAQAGQRIQDRLLFNKLSSLSLPVADRRSEEYLSDIPLPKSATLSFVSSPCSTGKTEILSHIIMRWHQKFPAGKILLPGYRNGLLDQLRQRLKIPSYRVGYGQDDAAINEFKKLAICLDSILKLKLENIPANTLLILDECEAIIKHGAQGGTLGNKRATVQAHVAAILDRVLSTGGAVIGLEDNLTDLSINGLVDLLDRKYPYEILENDLEKFHWDVKMCGGNPSHYIGLIIDRLKRGENILVPSSSQKFIETLERMVLQQMPELKDLVTRVDAKTTPDLHILLTDPNEWLASHPTRLLLLSPTVESGFSIKLNPVKPWFDRVMAYFVNLDTRAQNQLLSRLRSNCPRDIFVLAQGAEAGGARGRDPVALLQMRKAIANETSLIHGSGRIPTNAQGDVWNRLDAEFSARSALSAKYMAEYLEAELISRGHNVTQVDWEEVRLQENIDNQTEDAIPSQELAGVYKETKHVILTEENKILSDSDGKEIAVAQALTILHSSGSTYEKKQQAVKCLLHDKLPTADLSEEFLMAVHTEDRGAYLKQCETSWLLQYPDLAKHIDRTIFASQIQQPHVLYSQTPKLAQRIKLLLPIVKYIDDLATGREYMADDEIVVAIQQYALKHSKSFFNLFYLNIKEESALGNGNGAGSTQNSPVATVHKVLKLLGYFAKLERRVGKAGAQRRVYAIGNFDCPHRKEVYKALDYKHGAYLQDASSLAEIALVFNTTPNLKNEAIKPPPPINPQPLAQAELDNIASAADTLAAIVDLPPAEAIETLNYFRSQWTAEFLLKASKNLTFVQKIALKKLVVEMNCPKLAS